MRLSQASRADLTWWETSLPTAFRTIDHGTPSTIITTDASHIGWGAVVNGHKAQGLWSTCERALHINNLEMLAIKFGLTSLLDHTSDQHIRMQSDSLTAISYVMSMGGCHSEQCDSVAKEIWTLAIDHNIWLSAAHTPGKLNVVADKLSRDFNMTVEWQLHPTIFERISTVFSPPNIDLFASRINHQLDPYVSWKPDRNALFIDAFTINWGQSTNSYAFPPYCLISRCLQKVVQENASMIIVVPIWTTQAWFTRLLSLLIDHPKILQVTKEVLINPVLGNTHPLSHHLWLMACKISGLPSLNVRFLQPLPKSLCPRGSRQPRNNTRLTFTSGMSFVYRGKLIQCDRL